LKTAVYNIIKLDKAPLSYDGLLDAYHDTDKRSDGYLRDWYSNSTNYVIGGSKECASYSKEGDSYNREHLVPQSWFNKASPMKSDIVHVIPTDGYVNNRRGSYPLAEVGTTNYTSNNGYCKLGKCKTSGYSGTVFEPNDVIKGDIARVYFYMATCYQDKITKWGGDVITGTTYQPFAQWYLTMLMRWAKNDVMDEVEIARNNVVYKKQKNRNLFVDFPYLAEYIWGDSVDVAFNPYTSITTASDDHRYGSPVTPGPDDDELTPPVFSPDGGTYAAALTVTITAAAGTAIYYTTDGTSPIDNGIEYNGPITVEKSMTIKAVAVDAKDNKSEVASATYVIMPGIIGEELFAETFDQCDGKGGNSGGFSGSVASSQANFKPDHSDWSVKGFGGDQCARFGSGSKAGVVTTPTFTIQGETTFSFNAAPWGTDGTTLGLSVDGNATLSQTQVTMKEGEWSTFTVTILGSGPVSVTFTPTKRFFLDEVYARAVTTTPTLAGDVNKDGRVNVADVMLVVNLSLGVVAQDPERFDLNAADANSDGDINVTDVMAIVKLSLQN